MTAITDLVAQTTARAGHSHGAKTKPNEGEAGEEFAFAATLADVTAGTSDTPDQEVLTAEPSTLGIVNGATLTPVLLDPQDMAAILASIAEKVNGTAGGDSPPTRDSALSPSAALEKIAAVSGATAIQMEGEAPAATTSAALPANAQSDSKLTTQPDAELSPTTVPTGTTAPTTNPQTPASSTKVVSSEASAALNPTASGKIDANDVSKPVSERTTAENVARRERPAPASLEAGTQVQAQPGSVLRSSGQSTATDSETALARMVAAGLVQTSNASASDAARTGAATKASGDASTGTSVLTTGAALAISLTQGTADGSPQDQGQTGADARGRDGSARGTGAPGATADILISTAAAPASNSFALGLSAMVEAPTLSGVTATGAVMTPIAASLDRGIIDMAVDGQWIDRMAQEIVDLSQGNGRSVFQINPPNLGRLTVELMQSDSGNSVRMMAETDEAVSRLQAGRPALEADARLASLSLGNLTIEKQRDSTDSGRGQNNGNGTQAQLSQGQGQNQGQGPQGGAFASQGQSDSSQQRGSKPSSAGAVLNGTGDETQPTRSNDRGGDRRVRYA